MTKRYDAVLDKVRKSLPAHIEFARKTVADKLGVRERTLRLTDHELSIAVDKASRASLRGEVEGLIAENPGFLFADIEGVRHSTIYDELVGVISRRLVDDLRPEVDRIQGAQYADLDHEALLRTCNSALAELSVAPSEDGYRIRDRFRDALNDFSEPSRYGLLNFGAALDDAAGQLRIAGKPEMARRLFEEGYFALAHEERFVEAPALIP